MLLWLISAPTKLRTQINQGYNNDLNRTIIPVYWSKSPSGSDYGHRSPVSRGVRSYETTSNNDVLDRSFMASMHFRSIAGNIHCYCSSQHRRSISVKSNVVLLIWWFSFWHASRLRLVPVVYRGLLPTHDVCNILCLEHLQITLFFCTMEVA